MPVPTTTIRSRHPDVLNSEKPFGDFRDQLKENGWALIKNVMPKEKAEEYVDRTMAWLEGFDLGFDRTKPATWKADNLPLHGPSGIISSYAVGHEDFVWDARMEPGVIAAFQKLWGTDQLVVSYDAINVSLPHREDGLEAPKFWPHIDQIPELKGLDCIQGIINCTTTGPKDGGLCVLAGSHALNDAYFAPDGPVFGDEKVRQFTQDQTKWFESKGCKWVKVEAEPGDLIMWDSRTIHYGAPAEGDRTRVVFYACYGPAERISEEAYALKQDILSKWAITGHHPTQPVLHKLVPPFRNGEPDKAFRSEPVKKPNFEGDAKLRKLAGLEKY